MNAEIEELRRVYQALKMESERKRDARDRAITEFEIADSACDRSAKRLADAFDAWTEGGPGVS